MREAIAFAPEDTAWNADKIPGKGFVIGCCANLLVLDPTDDRVRFAHSSVKQYLEEGRESNEIDWYPERAQGVLECGGFCVAYLSFSDFSLQLSTPRYDKAAVAVPTPISIARETFPGFFTRLFVPKPGGQKRFVSMPFREIRTASTPDRIHYKFLDYAVTNWALQTKHISRTSLLWEKFERLSMCFNETWNIHPWAPGGQSTISHFHGLFGWAVTQQHEPLLSIARSAESDFKIVCNLPLIGESLPALHVAAKLGYKSIVKILLGSCNLNAPDLQGYTALHHAASKGNIDICRLLGSANINAPSKSRCTPLWLAASNGHVEVASFLIGRKADIEAEDASLHRTPLSQAAKNGHDQVVELLLGERAELESQDADGRTALSLAVEGWYEDTMKLLLEKGARGDLECNQLLLPWAAKNGHKSVFTLFSANSAHPNNLPGYPSRASGNPNRALLSWATEEGYETVVRMLLDEGADVEAEAGDREAEDGRWGQTLLSRAAENGCETVVQVLLEKGADIEAIDGRWGRTPLSWAARNNHDTVVRMLLEKGADVEAKDTKEWGLAPLSWAARNGNEAVAMMLLEKGADIETRDDKFGQTPLTWAVRNGQEVVKKLLLDNGAVLEDG